MNKRGGNRLVLCPSSEASQPDMSECGIDDKPVAVWKRQEAEDLVSGLYFPSVSIEEIRLHNLQSQSWTVSVPTLSESWQHFLSGLLKGKIAVFNLNCKMYLIGLALKFV